MRGSTRQLVRQNQASRPQLTRVGVEDVEHPAVRVLREPLEAVRRHVRREAQHRARRRHEQRLARRAVARREARLQVADRPEGEHRHRRVAAAHAGDAARRGAEALERLERRRRRRRRVRGAAVAGRVGGRSCRWVAGHRGARCRRLRRGQLHAHVAQLLLGVGAALALHQAVLLLGLQRRLQVVLFEQGGGAWSCWVGQAAIGNLPHSISASLFLSLHPWAQRWRAPWAAAGRFYSIAFCAPATLAAPPLRRRLARAAAPRTPRRRRPLPTPPGWTAPLPCRTPSVCDHGAADLPSIEWTARETARLMS